MLKNIDPLLSPNLLKHLRAMGHGDDLAIVDANFPARSSAQRLVRLDGASATDVLRAVLSVLPVDSHGNDPAIRMQVVDHPDEVPPICEEFQDLLTASTLSRVALSSIERFDFYDRARNAYAVVATAERRLYGNILLRKGVIDDSNEQNKL